MIQIKKKILILKSKPLPLVKPMTVKRTDSIDSVQMEFNQIFEKMFPKAAEMLNEHDERKLAEFNEEAIHEMIAVIDQSYNITVLI
jgi:hypothetical protein